MQTCIRSPNGKTRLCASILILVAAAGSPAFAQYPPPGSVAPPGSIIVTRDVPQRPAYDPGEPGTVNAVQTAPVDLIFSATNQVVSVLSDNETAGIVAGVDPQRGTSGQVFGGSESSQNGQFGTTSGPNSPGGYGGGLGGTITGSISTATNAIGRALTPLSSMGGSN